MHGWEKFQALRQAKQVSEMLWDDHASSFIAETCGDNMESDTEEPQFAVVDLRDTDFELPTLRYIIAEFTYCKYDGINVSRLWPATKI